VDVEAGDFISEKGSQATDWVSEKAGDAKEAVFGSRHADVGDEVSQKYEEAKDSAKETYRRCCDQDGPHESHSSTRIEHTKQKY